MAMPVTLAVWAPTEQLAQGACRHAFKRIAALEQTLSDYAADSELCRLNAQAGVTPVVISPDLFSILEMSKRVASRTQGAFDPTSGALFAVWRSARRANKLPNKNAIQNALGRGGYENLVLNKVNRTAHLIKPGVRLDLGGIAKGFIGDQVLLALKANGITRSRFAAGGDIVLGDPPEGEQGWKLKLPRLGTKLLSNCAVSISGDTQQFFVVDGKRYSHIVDPCSGQAITSRQIAIVIAPTGALSDPLATAGTVMEPGDFQSTLRKLSTVEGWTFRVTE